MKQENMTLYKIVFLIIAFSIILVEGAVLIKGKLYWASRKGHRVLVLGERTVETATKIPNILYTPDTKKRSLNLRNVADYSPPVLRTLSYHTYFQCNSKETLFVQKTLLIHSSFADNCNYIEVPILHCSMLISLQ